ncbi:MAG: DNA-processing protein DprA [Muribaculaceae bacterium]
MSMNHISVRQLALSQIKGLTAVDLRQVLERTGGVDRFFELPQAELYQLMGGVRGFCSDAERKRLLAWAETEAQFLRSNPVDAFFLDTPEYSYKLSQCEDAPAVLYRRGECSLNHCHMVAIVGTRNATVYGCDFTRTLVADLAKALDDVVIVSGLAYGIDVNAHRAALAENVPTIGVVAHGMRTIYPADHRDVAARMVRQGGAIVTEYPSNSPVFRGNFLARNRIIAGMCDVTVVVESDSHGGALVTASLASDYGREVAAVPGRSTDRYSRGCNQLIVHQKAAMIRGAEDLMDLMRWEAKAGVSEQASFVFDIDSLPADQRSIVNYLRSHPDATLNDMVAPLCMPFATLSSKVMDMEMNDIIVALPGGKFQLKV